MLKTNRKRAISLTLIIAMLITVISAISMPAVVAATMPNEAANKLHILGLFQGVGANADGTPNFDLDRAPTRHEAVTMLVRLLGKESEAQTGKWSIPFTDVADWAKPYVGYAYAKGLTKGTGDKTFSGNDPVTAAQYITFVLRALGYVSEVDFNWDKAWELSDSLGFTEKKFNSLNNASFLRGNVASVSFDALSAKLKNSTKTLCETLVDAKVFTKETAEKVGLYIISDTGIRLDKTELTLDVNKTESLKATVTPADAADKKVMWTSSNENIAFVSSIGSVMGVSSGKATITATNAYGQSATCLVTVGASAAEITLDKTAMTIELGKTAELKATILPTNTTDKTVTWTSSRESIAIVSDKGVVTGIAKGSATITATTANGKKATCVVTVGTPETAVTLDKTKLTLEIGITAELKATVLPSDAADKTVAWTSSNVNIATVSDKGVVTGIAKGSATITATTVNGKKATCAVTVGTLETAVTLDKTNLTVEIGKTAELKATVLPSDATDKTVEWSSSNTKIATVSDKGVVTGIAKGSATITVTTANGKKATCAVTVEAKEAVLDIGDVDLVYTSVDFSKLVYNSNPTIHGDAIVLTRNINITNVDVSFKTDVTSSNSSDCAATWTSSDESVIKINSVDNPAKLNGAGNYSAVSTCHTTVVGEGMAVLTATLKNGKKAQRTVYVMDKEITKAEFEHNPNPALNIDGTFKIEPIYYATHAGGDVIVDLSKWCHVAWTSSNPSIATVSDNGLVTAVGEGITTIAMTITKSYPDRATSASTTITVSCYVNVSDPSPEEDPSEEET